MLADHPRCGSSFGGANTSPVGFVPEVSCDERYAYLAPVEDAGALAAAMHLAIAAIGRSRDGNAQARNRVLEFTDPSVAADRFDKLLRAACLSSTTSAGGMAATQE